MSMVVCKKCGAYVDSDDDPDCFVETGNMRRLHQTTIMCEPCREKYYEDLLWDEPTGVPT